MATRVTTTIQRARGIADHRVIDDKGGHWTIRTIPYPAPHDGPAEGYRVCIVDPVILQPDEETAITLALEMIDQLRRPPRFESPNKELT